MNGRLLVAVCGMLALLADLPVGGGCLQQLPTDGTWAQYQVDIKIGNRGINASWVVRSVGSQTHNGQPCRWIEMQQQSDNPEFPKMTWRCLVPEAEFGEGKHPVGKAIKVWQKVEGQDAQSVGSIKARDPLFAALIQGPGKDLKVEEGPEVIRWQRGNLECQVVAGDSEAILKGALMKIHHRIFRNDEAPFQLGGRLWEVAVGGQTINVKMTLQDQGTDAKGLYPDLGP